MSLSSVGRPEGLPWIYRGKDIGQRLIECCTVPAALLRIDGPMLDTPALTYYEDGVLRDRLTYKDLIGTISHMAGWLKTSAGIGKSDRVIVKSANCTEAFITHLAIMSLGAITVPVSDRESERIQEFICRKVKPTLALVNGPDDGSLGRYCPVVSLKETVQAATGAEAGVVLDGEVLPDDPAVILFTSGTTSEPKGVCLSHYNLMVNAHALQQVHDLRSSGTTLCVLPLYHANAFGFSMVATIYAGGHVVLCNGLPIFQFWSIVRAESARVVSAVPELLRLLSRRLDRSAATAGLQYFVSAAAPLSKDLSRDFIAKSGVEIHQGYGLSECVNFAAAVRHDVHAASLERLMNDWRVPSIGPAVFGCEVTVRRPDGSIAAEEEEGEVAVSGHSVMLGYWEASEETEKALGMGYLSTGDLGFYASVDGIPHFFITGRRKEVIIRYGEKISPLAVEAELGVLPVTALAVVGFANSVSGQEIGLYVEDPDGSADAQAVLARVKDCPVLYRPRVVLFGSAPIPRTNTGKIRRGDLSGRFATFRDRVLGNDPVVEKFE